MTEADILATTYNDTCTVYRPYKTTAANMETVFKQGINGNKAYENIPCALSSPSGGKLEQSPSTAKAPIDYMLFTRPEVDIQPGDTVVVTHLEKEYITQAGRGEFMVSHNNIPLQLAKKTV